MKKIELKSKTSFIALILVLTFSAVFVDLPVTIAHDPPWTIVSYPFLVVSPNPIGVDQTAAVVMWVDEPIAGTLVENDIRRHNYTLTITKPDETVLTQHWDVVQDTTSIQYFLFTPDQIGTYILRFDYGGQIFEWSATNERAPFLGDFQNDIILPATKTTTLTVQEEPVPGATSRHPLPTEYWTRPIEGQNWNWYTAASNWLSAPYVNWAGQPYPMGAINQPFGTAPNTAHIMWTKPIQWGGTVGGDETTVPGEAFYTGNSYELRWQNPIVMWGTMFYQEPLGNSGVGGDYVAVDLRTGKEIWRIDPAATGLNLVPEFGYLYAWESPNQHGVLPNGLLIATARVPGQGNVWRGYDPRTGVLTGMNVTNVPPWGAAVAGPRGEYLQYFVYNMGTDTNPNWRLMQWNSSRVFSGGNERFPDFWYNNLQFNSTIDDWVLGTADASLPSAYDYDVSLNLPPGRWDIWYKFWQYSQFIEINNMILLGQGMDAGHPFDPFGPSRDGAPVNITAVSLKPESLGQVLWSKSYKGPENNSRYLTEWDTEAGIFILKDRHLMEITAYSIDTGEKVWGPISLLDSDFQTELGFLDSSAVSMGNSKVYVAGYSGLVKAFDAKTGSLLWTYGNGGEGNSTFVGGVGPFGRTPLFVNLIADGKIFTSSVQHSPNSPLYMNYKFRALNATDGTELWTLGHYGNLMYSSSITLADGYLSFLNNYDSQIYTIGKGPSALAIDAPKASIELGRSLVISGTVTDISAGTKQAEQAARFPNGVPAVSDQSMSAWMEYVYQQKPKPTDTIGVDVLLSIRDPNNNYHDFTVTTDSLGMYSLMWEPPVPGKYTVNAIFKGTESYWPSQGEAFFGVDETPSSGGPIEPEPSPSPSPSPSPAAPLAIPTEIIVAAVVAVAVVAGIGAYWVIRKRR